MWSGSTSHNIIVSLEATPQKGVGRKTFFSVLAQNENSEVATSSLNPYQPVSLTAGSPHVTPSYPRCICAAADKNAKTSACHAESKLHLSPTFKISAHGT